LICEF